MIGEARILFRIMLSVGHMRWIVLSNGPNRSLLILAVRVMVWSFTGPIESKPKVSFVPSLATWWTLHLLCWMQQVCLFPNRWMERNSVLLMVYRWYIHSMMPKPLNNTKHNISKCLATVPFIRTDGLQQHGILFPGSWCKIHR